MTEFEILQALYHAVIIQAARDYRSALRGSRVDGKPPEMVVAEIEGFFRSYEFSIVTKISGEYLIEKLRRELSAQQKEESK